MASTFKVEFEMKCDAEKIWDAVRNYVVFFPKAFPQIYKKIEVLHGDGYSPGSIRKNTYVEGGPMATLTEKMEVSDEANKTISYYVIDGDLMKFYKTFKSTVTVVRGAKEDGAMVTYFGEYEKLEDDAPNPDLLEGFVVNTLTALDAYLLNE